MKDGDYKFQLDVQKKYKDLLNKGNNKKRIGGNLIVEIVPKDRKSSDVYLPKNGDKRQTRRLERDSSGLEGRSEINYSKKDNGD